jgi:CubicO group peptidase (beta-lactamase class C family)
MYKIDSEGWLKAMAALPLGFQPGTAWSYGTSSEALSILINRVSGLSFGEFLRQRIFDPLDMKDTGHLVPLAKRARLATVYQRSPGEAAITVSPQYNDFPKTPPAFPFGGYGLASTVDDYLRFARMLLERGKRDDVQILSHRAVSLMTSNYLSIEQRAAIPPPVTSLFKSQGWGLGLAMVGPAPSERGGKRIPRRTWSRSTCIN